MVFLMGNEVFIRDFLDILSWVEFLGKVGELLLIFNILIFSLSF